MELKDFVTSTLTQIAEGVKMHKNRTKILAEL